MKKFAKILGKALFGFVAAIIAVVLCVCCIFWIPLDYVRYKRSPYYKNTRKKYSLFAGSGPFFEINNEIFENGLPIEYFQNPNERSGGWFALGSILLIVNAYTFTYDHEAGNWSYYLDDENKSIRISLEECLELDLAEANRISGDDRFERAVLLISAECLNDIEGAKGDPRFLIYEGNRAEVLKAFCAENTKDF